MGALGEGLGLCGPFLPSVTRGVSELAVVAKLCTRKEN